jgi:glycosyltransferase involved in cell wall biosynthesis
MRRRMVILTEIIAPYRIPVFNALAARSDVDPHVVFFSENDPSLRQWQVYKDEIRFSYEVLPGWRRRLGKYNLLLNWGVRSALRHSSPDAVVCAGYSYLACWEAAMWARHHSVPLLLWTESTSHDSRHRYAPVEFMKKRFFRLCRAYVAAGKASREYLLGLGASGQTIHIAPDAVDVQFFSTSATKAREQADKVRSLHGLPSRYFLCVGRLVREKGVFDLLSAYATLDEHTRSQLGLVFVGDGSARSDLQRRATRVGCGVVKFVGWVHRGRLPELYALAEALIFPTHSDTWGLVVNEAMACQLPIVASDIAGCVPDLVEDGWNGLLVQPANVQALANAMTRLFLQPDLALRMGSHSRERIQAFLPESCAEGLAKAMAFACNGSA